VFWSILSLDNGPSTPYWAQLTIVLAPLGAAFKYLVWDFLHKPETMHTQFSAQMAEAQAAIHERKFLPPVIRLCDQVTARKAFLPKEANVPTIQILTELSLDAEVRLAMTALTERLSLEGAYDRAVSSCNLVALPCLLLIVLSLAAFFGYPYQAAGEHKENHELAPVIHISKGFPETEFARLAADYRNDAFDGLILFINDLQECKVPTDTLQRYARLVTVLRDVGKPLLGMFGGYFTLMLRKLGLGSFSNAVGYGEYRDSSYREGGQAIRRYYLPSLHRYVTDIEAQSLTDIVNEDWFRCACTVCRSRPQFTDLTSEQLLTHFLNSRFTELQDASRAQLANLITAIDETTARLNALGAVFPRTLYEHLSRWSQTLRPFS
jgi:hypothetical protein